MRIFRRKIATTQSKYKAILQRKTINQQCSYNLPLECEDYLITNGALEKITPLGNNREVDYRVSDGFRVELGENILAIVGRRFENSQKKAIFTHTEGEDASSRKLQLKRAKFNEYGQGYEWFVELYDHNIESLVFTTGLDLENHVIKFDLELSNSLFENDGDEDVFNTPGRKRGGTNVIYYGTPGCGKSFLINKIAKNEDGDPKKAFKTVFHPEYSNADFVGQVMPDVDPEDPNRVTYPFKEGAFTSALKYALENPREKVYLLIEEINRGNASAIFGEIFQLLDRDADGTSAFAIHNHLIARSLGLESNAEIRIPSNLFIIATMNTSDQNVFTLDTAFKRRWEMVKIRNSFNDVGENEYKRNLSEMYVPGSHFTWRDFVERLNSKIAERCGVGMIRSEDKEVGVFFVDPNYLCEMANDNDPNKIRRFGQKILMYLWNDVTKTNHESLFKTEIGGRRILSLDALLDEFESVPDGDSLYVFNEDTFPREAANADHQEGE